MKKISGDKSKFNVDMHISWEMLLMLKNNHCNIPIGCSVTYSKFTVVGLSVIYFPTTAFQRLLSIILLHGMCCHFIKSLCKMQRRNSYEASIQCSVIPEV